MARCQVCDRVTVGLMAELCSECQEKRRTEALGHLADLPPTTGSQEETAGSEGSTAQIIGNTIMWLSLIAGIACALFYGQVSMPDGLSGSQMAWNSTLIAIFLGAGFNGAFFGYALSKIGSVLRHLESLKATKPAA